MRLPDFLGGHEVVLETDGMSENEVLVGWIDEHGTIMSESTGQIIGDLVSVKDHEITALILKKGVRT